MATGPGYPSGTNTFVPSFEASGQLVIGYSRNPKAFALPRYCQYVKSPKTTGYYLKITAQEAARVVTVQDDIWPDGASAPSGADNQESFNFLPFLTERYAYPFFLGRKAVDQAAWAIREEHAMIAAQRAMTARTVLAFNALTTSTNWTAAGSDPDMGADHTNTATSLGGGTWASSTTTNLYIKSTLNAVAVQINIDTLGKVGNDVGVEHCIVLSPRDAAEISQSAEIHDYIKGSYWAKEEITEGLSPNNKFGLPSSIYGYPLCIESAVRVTTRKLDASLAKDYVVPDGEAYYLSRPGGMEGVYGSPSFSTLTMFWYNDEMTVESKDDVDNRRLHGRVVQDVVFKVTAPASGFRITGIS
jgi:hypothetical protein